MNNIIIQDGALEVRLPKWPAMVIVGRQVSKRIAAEILIRTDTRLPDYTYGTNDREFGKQICDLFGIPFAASLDGDYLDIINQMRYFSLRVLDIGYLCNEQIASCYVGGPHGWCNWNGEIYSDNYNIGKWPDAHGIAEEWAIIAKEFPVLNLRCQLFDEELSSEGEKIPIIEYMVDAGRVLVSKPIAPLMVPNIGISEEIFETVLLGYGERGISIENLKNNVLEIYGGIPQYGQHR